MNELIEGERELLHALITDLWAMTDPEEHPELCARAEAVLKDCDGGCVPPATLTCGNVAPIDRRDLAPGHDFDHANVQGLAWKNDRPGAYDRMPACPHGSGVSAAECGFCEDEGIWPLPTHPQEPS
jgi:hypothetical protein